MWMPIYKVKTCGSWLLVLMQKFLRTLRKMLNQEGNGRSRVAKSSLSILRTSISKEFINHIRDVNSPKEVWETLERLFSKKNTARLQLLENELAMLTQGGMSISEYFLCVKSIYAEISELDADEKISEVRLRRYLIRGLKEYTPFVTSIQG